MHKPGAQILPTGSTAYLYTFNDGNFRKREVLLLPDRYVKVLPDGEPIPIEDTGDYLLIEDSITVEEAFEKWCKLIGE